MNWLQWPGLHRLSALLVLALAVLRFASMPALAARQPDPVTVIGELIAPAKLATLDQRGANPRVQKYVYWLAIAQQKGQNVTNVVNSAVARAGYKNPLARQLTAAAMLRNLKIADGYQCLDRAGLAEMRRGKSATIRRGTYRGNELSVDHIIPRAVCPELDNVMANLELMPLRRNESKNDKIASRQVQTAEQFYRAGLLSSTGLRRIKSAAK